MEPQHWTLVTAVVSAAAAAAAAYNAWMLRRIQKQNLLQSIRPELVLSGWSRCSVQLEDGVNDSVMIKELTNVGRGPALDVWMLVGKPAKGEIKLPPKVPTLSLLAPNHSETVDFAVVPDWEQAKKAGNESPRVECSVCVFFHDTCQNLHSVCYEIRIEGMGQSQFSPFLEPLAYCVQLKRRRHKMQSAATKTMLECATRMPLPVRRIIERRRGKPRSEQAD